MANPPASLTLMSVGVSATLTTAGVVITGAQAILDLSNVNTMSVQFGSPAAVQISIQGSTDWGVTWTTIVPPDLYMGLGPYRTGWWPIPPALQADNIQLQAVGIGTIIALISYITVQYQ